MERVKQSLADISLQVGRINVLVLIRSPMIWVWPPTLTDCGRSRPAALWRDWVCSRPSFLSTKWSKGADWEELQEPRGSLETTCVFIIYTFIVSVGLIRMNHVITMSLIIQLTINHFHHVGWWYICTKHFKDFQISYKNKENKSLNLMSPYLRRCYVLRGIVENVKEPL